MKLNIVCSRCQVYEGVTSYLKLDTMSGWIGILPGHAPLISIIKSGRISCRTNEGMIYFDVNEGMLKFEDNEIKIFATDADQCMPEEVTAEAETEEGAGTKEKNRQ